MLRDGESKRIYRLSLNDHAKTECKVEKKVENLDAFYMTITFKKETVWGKRGEGFIDYSFYDGFVVMQI